MALSSESVGSLLVALGVATRVVALPIVVTMATVLLLVVTGFQGADTEAAALYTTVYLALALIGPGRISVDHWLGARLKPNSPWRRVIRPSA